MNFIFLAPGNPGDNFPGVVAGKYLQEPICFARGILCFLLVLGIPDSIADSVRYGEDMHIAATQGLVGGSDVSKETSAPFAITSYAAAPMSGMWEVMPVSVADSSKWRAYGSNLISDEGSYTRITIQSDGKGAYLFLDQIASVFGGADNKNYKIVFTAYVASSSGPVTGKVVIRNNAMPGEDAIRLTANPKEYTVRRSNTREEKVLMRFDGLSVGSTVYVGSQIRIERMLDRVYEHPFAEPFKGGTLDMSVGVPDIPQWFSDLHDAGARYVRIQVNPKISMEGMSKAQYLEAMVRRFNSEYLPFARRYGIKVLFGMESIPYDDEALNNRKNPGYWENPETLQNFKDTAHYIANAFKDVPEVFALQFMSEPVDLDNKRPENWNRISAEVIDVVRQYTDKFIVWSNGVGGSATYATAVPWDDGRIIYNFHEFKPHRYTHQGIRDMPLGMAYPGPVDMLRDVRAMVEFRNRNNNVPIMCGSFSLANWISDGDLWVSDFLGLLQENHISSIQFATGQYRAWDWRYVGVYDGVNPPSFDYDVSGGNRLWALLSDYWTTDSGYNRLFSDGFE